MSFWTSRTKTAHNPNSIIALLGCKPVRSLSERSTNKLGAALERLLISLSGPSAKSLTHLGARGRHAAEQAATRLQKIVAEEKDQIARLTRDLAEAQTERERVQSRIKALLERLEAIEE